MIFVNPDDLSELRLVDGARVDIVSEGPVGTERRAAAFRVVAYPTARGCAAAYFPEANVLVPLDATAAGSNTPASKDIIIRLEPVAPAPRVAGGPAGPPDPDPAGPGV